MSMLWSKEVKSEILETRTAQAKQESQGVPPQSSIVVFNLIDSCVNNESMLESNKSEMPLHLKLSQQTKVCVYIIISMSFLS